MPAHCTCPRIELYSCLEEQPLLSHKIIHKLTTRHDEFGNQPCQGPTTTNTAARAPPSKTLQWIQGPVLRLVHVESWGECYGADQKTLKGTLKDRGVNGVFVIIFFF